MQPTLEYNMHARNVQMELDYDLSGRKVNLGMKQDTPGKRLAEILQTNYNHIKLIHLQQKHQSKFSRRSAQQKRFNKALLETCLAEEVLRG